MDIKQKKKLKENASAYVMLLPQLIGLVVFGVLPIVMVLVISLTEWNVIGSMHFVGLKSLFAELKNPYFIKSMSNTFIFVIMNVPLTIGIALIIAMLLNKVRFKVFFRAVYFMPVVTSVVASVMIWQWLYHPDFGPLNAVLNGVFHLPVKILWLGSTKTAMISIVIMTAWQSLGYGLILFLAGLQAVPGVYYEAATIDGANTWQKTMKITLPLLSPTMFYCVITSIIGSFQVFGQPYLLTQGGPLNSTYTIAMHIFQEGFVNMEMGRACAASLVLFANIIIITGIQFWVSKRWVFYEGD